MCTADPGTSKTPWETYITIQNLTAAIVIDTDHEDPFMNTYY